MSFRAVTRNLYKVTFETNYVNRVVLSNISDTICDHSHIIKALIHPLWIPGRGPE